MWRKAMEACPLANLLCYAWSRLFKGTISPSCCWFRDLELLGSHLRSFSGQNLIIIHKNKQSLKRMFIWAQMDNGGFFLPFPLALGKSTLYQDLKLRKLRNEFFLKSLLLARHWSPKSRDSKVTSTWSSSWYSIDFCQPHNS